MRLKSYFAASVEAAIEQARQELGDEAMLVDSRATSRTTRHLGACEVVFALEEPKAGTKTPGKGEMVACQPGPKPPDANRLLGDLSELRREMERMSEAVARSGALSAGAGGLLADAELARVYTSLLSEDVAPEVAQELLAGCSKKPVRDDVGRIVATRLAGSLREQMERQLSIQPELGNAGRISRNFAGKAVALVGPPGAGKTTALVKLAVQYGLRSRKPMQILSLDSYRIGAAGQLRHYAGILGVGFQTVESPGMLSQCLAENRHKEWIFIDTPGLSKSDADVIQELALVLDRHREIDVHLVLSAAVKFSDLRAAAERFEAMRPAKLLFAHMDETDTFGGVFSIAAQSKRPVSFLCGGQRIPEDLEPASVEGILSRIPVGARKREPLKSNPFALAGSAAAGL
ncbi:MAG: Flagellar biosynthesis protein FlhF [Bryobacteraceae bacterium]|nr:Flagellar biosynthesis protein FlhF [Bryobacteraceae bacterium]